MGVRVPPGASLGSEDRKDVRTRPVRYGRETKRQVGDRGRHGRMFRDRDIMAPIAATRRRSGRSRSPDSPRGGRCGQLGPSVRPCAGGRRGPGADGSGRAFWFGRAVRNNAPPRLANPRGGPFHADCYAGFRHRLRFSGPFRGARRRPDPVLLFAVKQTRRPGQRLMPAAARRPCRQTLPAAQCGGKPRRREPLEIVFVMPEGV